MRTMASQRSKWIAIGLAITLIVLGLWGAAFLLSSTAPVATAFGEWEERVLREGDPSAKVVMVSVSGEIFSDPQGFAPGASDENIVRQLDQAEADESVVALIVDLDTPGGGVVASDVIYRRILSFKEVKPVVALMGDTAASGGYYIAAAADEIVANPATITGSIGVIMFIPNLEGTAGKLGIEPIVLKSGPHKDIASPFRDMTPEERSILQGVIDEAFNQFVDAVASGRQIDPARVREVADGRIYTGRQAKDLGLIDHLGGRQLALERAETLAEISDVSLVLYEKPRGFAESLLGLESLRGLSGRQLVEDSLGVDLKPGLKYLWLP